MTYSVLKPNNVMSLYVTVPCVVVTKQLSDPSGAKEIIMQFIRSRIRVFNPCLT
jgi:hypothetical protein